MRSATTAGIERPCRARAYRSPAVRTWRASAGTCAICGRRSTGRPTFRSQTEWFWRLAPAVAAATLDSLGLSRVSGDSPDRQRPGMTYGNRLWLGRPNGTFRVPAWGAQVADAGWAWGVVAADFDNDGELDFYIANGHETLGSVRDYDRQFWLHDLYVGASTNNSATELYYRSVLGRRRAEQRSYGGWQENVCFRRGLTSSNWVNVAWLWGIATAADCRNLVAEDFDGDGRIDLAVTTFEAWPERRQRLLVYRNQLQNIGHWIGFQIPMESNGGNCFGTCIRVTSALGTQTRWLISGDSFRSQQSYSAHFGLGTEEILTQVEVLWPGGKTLKILNARVDAWQTLKAD